MYILYLFLCILVCIYTHTHIIYIYKHTHYKINIKNTIVNQVGRLSAVNMNNLKLTT